MKINLKKLQDEKEKQQTFDSSFFISQNYFFNDGAQPYLIFQTLCYTLKKLGDRGKIVSWKSEGLPAEKYTTPTTTHNSSSPLIKSYGNSNFCLVFKGSFLKKSKLTQTPPNKIFYFIVYESNS